MSDFPEHDKLSKIHEESNIISEFLEWLNTSELTLCKYKAFDESPSYKQFSPTRKSIENILAEYFGIDLPTLNLEKELILKKFGSKND